MKYRGGQDKRKRWFILAPLLVLFAASIFLAVSITREPELQRLQIPNAVEAYEANRKLRILETSAKQSRKGFVRLSELEINSLLEPTIAAKQKARSSGSTASISNSLPVKNAIQLTTTNFTFFSWHKQSTPVGAATLAFQRTLELRPGQPGTKLQLTGMKVGRLAIPESLWTWMEAKLDPNRELVTSRLPWLNSAVSAQITQNELSKFPEFRLYSYMPAHLMKR
ncbi:MAG: hypothetical protein ACO1QB_06275 [Verrucomicrobiales bacterium]